MSLSIPLIKPSIYNHDLLLRIGEILQSGILTKGPYVKEFAAQLALRVNALSCHTTTSATTALYSALVGIGIKPGDEVIVSDFSYPATANVVVHSGAIPVFADVSIETFNASAASIESVITPRTKAVIFVDAFGNPSGLPEVLDICRKYSIPLIEDAACALGSSISNYPCGSIADITCFSFHPRKVLTTGGEGGAICTNNPDFQSRLDVLLNHGGVLDPTLAEITFIEPGFNFRMTEIQAAIGLYALQDIDATIDVRNRILETYKQLLPQDIFVPQLIHSEVAYNAQSIVFRMPSKDLRDRLITHLRQHSIESTIGTYSLSSQPYYAVNHPSMCPSSCHLYHSTITLPCYDGLCIGRVIDTISSWSSQ